MDILSVRAWFARRQNPSTNCVPATTEIGDKCCGRSAMLLLCCGDNTNAADLRLKTQGFSLKTQLGEGFSRKPFRVKTNAGRLSALGK
jgi:hypothetical protein